MIGKVRLDTIQAAAVQIRPYVVRTPLLRVEHGDAELLLKPESLQVTGAFKIRGGINLMSRLGPDDRRRGVISASTGNHGQSIAYAGRLFDVAVVLVFFAVPSEHFP